MNLEVTQAIGSSSFSFLGSGFLKSFHRHSCPSIMIICIQPRAVAGADAGMARHVGAPPGRWCPTQTAHSAYSERRYWIFSASLSGSGDFVLFDSLDEIGA